MGILLLRLSLSLSTHTQRVKPRLHFLVREMPALHIEVTGQVQAISHVTFAWQQTQFRPHFYGPCHDRRIRPHAGFEQILNLRMLDNYIQLDVVSAPAVDPRHRAFRREE